MSEAQVSGPGGLRTLGRGEAVTLRHTGALAGLDPGARAELLTRHHGEDARVRDSAARIVERVRREGDAALRELALEFDGAVLQSLEVPRARWEIARAALAPELRAALERARDNIHRAHAAARPYPQTCETEPGVRVGRRPDALDRVGVYAPGGRARYPSSVLMGAAPARVAGVREIILCTPPAANGEPDALLLAAAAIAGVDRVFALGGAGAIAALAYGTATVPAVRKIVGPGNAWVSAAKRLVAADGAVAIDSPAGPSELVVVADAGADPDTVALELVAQAEHDPDALALALVVGEVAAARVTEALAHAARAAVRSDVVRAALAARGGVLAATTVEQALAFACELAPEHLLLAVCDPHGAFESVRDAGTVFLGAGSSVAFGDYLTGGNHVLPTAGFARLASGLGTGDFVRWTTWQEISPAAAVRLATDTAVLAEAEGLPGHAAAARRAGCAVHDTEAPPVLWLDDNTSPFGAPPAASERLAHPGISLARYPSALADELRGALATHSGFACDELVTGCGSDDVLDLAFRALARPGERVAWTSPTFSMIPAFVAHAGLIGNAVPERAASVLDVAALLTHEPAIVYVCSPGNPTGSQVPRAVLDELLERARGVVILDEAYVEFASAGKAPPPRRHPRLVVARTFSKAWGLAGLRVGWAAGPRELIARIAALRSPFRIPALSEIAVVAALENDTPWVATHAAQAVELRERFARALVANGFAPVPSQANFVLVPVRDAPAAAAALAERGVRVRAFPALEGMGDALRISVAPWPAMERVLAALAEVRP